MGQILDTIQGARTRLSEERHWARGVMARRLDGVEVGALDVDAIQWCALGALRLSAANRYRHGAGTVYSEARAEVAERLIRLGYAADEDYDYLGALGELDAISIVSSWNDNTESHEDILTALDAVIASIEAGESVDDFEAEAEGAE